jgi:hypothetical protein
MTGGTLPGGARVWEVDWVRLARRSLLGSLIVLAAICLYVRYEGSTFGFDFHGGAWPAARAILGGHSPYPRPDAKLLLQTRNAFVTPPILGELAIPLSWLKFRLAATVWDLVCTLSFIATLWVLGLRDTRLYVLALCSLPFVDSFQLAQSDGVLVLLAALAWRLRDSSWSGLAVGVLIAAKLLAWPLLIWLLATRRFRSLLAAVSTAGGLLAASWAPIDFHGMGSYPALLAADVKAFGGWVYSNSFAGAFTGVGLSPTLAAALSGVVALAVALAMIAASRATDEGLFAACVMFGLLASPILWPHYLLFLFVVLAISRPGSFGAWALTVPLWIALFDVAPMLRISVVLVTTVAVAIWAVSTKRSDLVARGRTTPRRSRITTFAIEQGPSALT